MNDRQRFGWDYPAGAANDPNAPWNEKDHAKGCPCSEDYECPDCGGKGYTVKAEHHPSCTGGCDGLCPVETQVQCSHLDDDCICDELARDAKADAAEARRGGRRDERSS